MKRENYISWDDYFMWIAVLSSHRSKDPSTQVWACIVDRDKKIIWIWYNWFPTACSDDEFPRDNDWDFYDKKNTYVVHAEANAILNSFWWNIKWATIYVVFFPCNECSKLIIQSGIKKVIYLSSKYKWWEQVYLASKRMLESAWVAIHQCKPIQKNIQISFDY